MRYDEHWHEKYQIVKEYLTAHPGKLPPKDVVYKNINIRYWLCNQRRLLKRKQTAEYKERLELLRKLNCTVSFDMNGKPPKPPAVKPEQGYYEMKWYRRYAELKAYIECNKRIPNSRQHPALSMWISRQRKKLIAGTLNKDQIEKLSLIGITQQ